MSDPDDPYRFGRRVDRAAAGPAQGWGFALPVALRFSDVDAFGHVNNATYLTYFEAGRVTYLRTVLGVESVAAMTFIMARAEVDFRRPVLFGDALQVLVRAKGIGSKSFTLAYRLLLEREGQTHVAAESISVIVCYDYATARSVPVPPALVAALEAFEGQVLRAMPH